MGGQNDISPMRGKATILAEITIRSKISTCFTIVRRDLTKTKLTRFHIILELTY